MRHRKHKNLFGRFTAWRIATIKSLSRAILLNQEIRTTKAKAKAAQRLIEELISLGKKGDLNSRRKIFSYLQDHKLVKRLCEEIAPRFSSRTSGFTRVIKLGNRRGDDAELVLMELTEKEVKQKSKKEEKAKEEKLTEVKPETQHPHAVAPEKEKPIVSKKPSKKFLGGLKGIFKKEQRDSL